MKEKERERVSVGVEWGKIKETEIRKQALYALFILV